MTNLHHESLPVSLPAPLGPHTSPYSRAIAPILGPLTQNTAATLIFLKHGSNPATIHPGFQEDTSPDS